LIHYEQFFAPSGVKKLKLKINITITIQCMDYITVKDGNLLDATEEYIAHQCNCVSTNAKGIAKQIFDVFPFANTYKKRQYKNAVETIEILSNGKTNIINMYAQYYPSIPQREISLGKSKNNYDTKEQRIKWFTSCLNKIAEIPNINNIAMPYNIGCGCAGGDWNVYFGLIQKFAKDNKIHVVLYRFE